MGVGGGGGWGGPPAPPLVPYSGLNNGTHGTHGGGQKDGLDPGSAAPGDDANPEVAAASVEGDGMQTIRQGGMMGADSGQIIPQVG